MKSLTLAIGLLFSVTTFAQHEACLLRIDHFGDVNKLSCNEGDYVTIWSDSKTPKPSLSVSAAMMHVCDLSKPFSFQSKNPGSKMSVATCTVKTIRTPVIPLDEHSRSVIN